MPNPLPSSRVGKLVQMIVAAALFAALAVFLFALSWNAEYVGYASDDAFYLLMADAFSPYHSADPALTGYAMSQSLFPPFYPLLLAVFGGGSADLLASHWITTASLLLALLAFGCWTRLETRNPWLAIWLTCIVALLPRTLLLDLEIFSEFPYLLLSVLALWLAASEARTTRTIAFVALCVGMAAITRSAGLAMLVAFGMWLLGQRIRGRALWLALTLALAPSIVWSVYRSHYAGQADSYGTGWLWVWELLREKGLWQFMGFLAAQCGALWSGLLADFDLRSTLLAKAALISTLLLGLPVWAGRLGKGRLDALYLLIAVATIALWPYPYVFDRLLLPLVPIVLLYACLGALGIAAGWREFSGKPVPAYGFLAALSLMLLPSLGFIVHRFNQSIDPELAGWKHTHFWFQFDSMDQIVANVSYRRNLVRAASELRQWVPEGECAYGVHIAINMLYGRRIVRQPPAPLDGRAKPFEELPQECRFYFLVNRGGQIGGFSAVAYYPRERLPADRLEVVHVWEDAHSPDKPTAILMRVKPPA